MLVDDCIEFGVDFSGEIDNYDSLADIAVELQRVIDDWVTWNVDGDYISDVVIL